MRKPVKITTPILSFDETAKLFGVSQKRAKELARLAEQIAGPKTPPSKKEFIVTALAEKSGVEPDTAGNMLKNLAELAVKQTKKDGVFVVPGIGRLVVSKRKARRGRNPVTGDAIKIPAKKVVKFRVSKSAQDAILSAGK